MYVYKSKCTYITVVLVPIIHLWNTFVCFLSREFFGIQEHFSVSNKTTSGLLGGIDVRNQDSKRFFQLSKLMHILHTIKVHVTYKNVILIDYIILNNL